MTNRRVVAVLAVWMLGMPGWAQTQDRPRDILTEIERLVHEMRTLLPPMVVELADAAAIADAFAKSGHYRIRPGTYVGNFRITGTDLTIEATDVRFEPLAPSVPTVVIRGSRIRLTGLTVANGYAGGDTFNVGENAITGIADLPRDVTLDRVTLVAGVGGGKRGFGLHGINIRLLECKAVNFWRVGQDSQAVWINNGPGPYTIEGGYFEASGENIMVGGALPGIASAEGVPSDITVRGAHLFKPLAWKEKPGSVKNLFELKAGKRVLVEDCTLENNWKDAQAGSAILIKADAQGTAGQTPWMETSDVTFRRNRILNSPNSYVINLRGVHTSLPAVRVRNIRFEQNLFVGVSAGVQSGNGVDGLVLDHNTFVGVSETAQILTLYSDEPIRFLTPLTWTGNLHAGRVKGSGAVYGRASLDAYAAPGWVFTSNVIETAYSGEWPVGNTTLRPGTLATVLQPPDYRYDGAGW